MASRFKFRLQAVLDLRLREEEHEKLAYGDVSRRRIEAENELVLLNQERLRILVSAGQSLEARLTMEARLSGLDDREADQHVIIGVLRDEEEQARLRWLEARKAFQAMEKLRERRWEEYQHEQNRIEQIEMDEWATLRRSA